MAFCRYSHTEIKEAKELYLADLSYWVNALVQYIFPLVIKKLAMHSSSVQLIVTCIMFWARNTSRKQTEMYIYKLHQFKVPITWGRAVAMENVSQIDMRSLWMPGNHILISDKYASF